MNIQDEYFTDEVPTEAGVYITRDAVGVDRLCVTVDQYDIWWTTDMAPVAMVPSRAWGGLRFCRLAPAAEVERLKAENEKLKGLVYDAYAEGEQDVRRGGCGWAASVTKSELDRLEGRLE